MAGVDWMDQNVGDYRIHIRSKKWWWCLFTFLVDTSIHNAFRIYKKSRAYANRNLDHYQFRREIARVYLANYTAGRNVAPQAHASQVGSRRKVDNEVSLDIRFDRKDHCLGGHGHPIE